jgi:hypothetical protein
MVLRRCIYKTDYPCETVHECPAYFKRGLFCNYKSKAAPSCYFAAEKIMHENIIQIIYMKQMLNKKAGVNSLFRLLFTTVLIILLTLFAVITVNAQQSERKYFNNVSAGGTFSRE